MAGARRTPGNTVEHAAEAAMDAAERHLSVAGASVEKILVVIEASGLTEHENCVTAGRGFEDARETVAFLLTEAMTAGKQIGFDVRIIPMGAGQG